MHTRVRATYHGEAEKIECEWIYALETARAKGAERRAAEDWRS
jgi:hypothetical protein